MALYNVRVMCFLVLMAWNSGNSFVLKSMVAPSFLTGHGLVSPLEIKSPVVEAADKRVKNLEMEIEHNDPNIKAPDQRVKALEKKIEDLLHDNDKKELRIEHLETAIEHNDPNIKAPDQRAKALEKKIEDLLHDNDKKELRIEHLETAIESKSSYLEATDKRVKNLERKIKNKSAFAEDTVKRVDNFERIIGNLSRDNERKEVRLGDLETTMRNLSHDNKRKEIRLGDLESAIKKKSPYQDATDKRVDTLVKTVAKLKSSLEKDCGPPSPVDGTEIVYNSSKVYATAVYKCKKGLLLVNPDGKRESSCQESETWTPVKIKCANISRCSVKSGRKMLYTGTEYETLSGQTCQRWDSQMPHTHTYTDHYFNIPGMPQTVSGSANYCRDPAGSGYLWCYTMDINLRWEKCYVPEC